MKLFSRIFSMLVAAFAFSVLFCAPTFAEETLSITVDGSPNVEATPNVLGTGTVDVYVSSSSRDGYKLSISDSDNDNSLVSGFNSINPLAGSVTADNFTTNAWGVKVGDNFLPVPKLSDNVLELANTTKAASNEKHTVTFGMKVDGTAVSGDYSSEVVFTAVANPLVVRQTKLQPGPAVNAAWKTLVTGSAVAFTAEDTAITSIQQFTGNFTEALRNSAANIATSDSAYPVYTWFNNGTIYYYTEADEVFFNEDSSYMFSFIKQLESVDFNFGTDDDVIPGNNPVYSTSITTNMQGMFWQASALTTLDVSKWDTSNVTRMDGMFYSASALTTLDVSKWDTGNVTMMNSMFSGAKSLTALDVSKWDTGNVTSMGGMFQHTDSLVTLDVSKWNTSNVTNMGYMFQYTTSLDSVDVSKWNTSNVTNMDSMFWYASALTTLDVSKWDTSNVTNMRYMFYSASALTTLDVSKWDTGNVTNMDSMFSFASALTTLDVSKWDTGNVTNMMNMFWYASALTTLDVSKWDTSNVTDMGGMFVGTTSLVTLDLSNWNTSMVTNMDGMFFGAKSLTTIYASNKFNTNIVSESDNMFFNTTSLVGGNGTTYNSNHLDKEYARIDAPGTPGYFTEKASTADLETGKVVNTAWKTLANGTATPYTGYSSNITSIKQYSGEFTKQLRNSAQNIATSASNYPVYTWYDNGTIYYYSDANTIFLNTDSSSMFCNLGSLADLDNNFDTSKVTDMNDMLSYTGLTTLDLSGWDMSNVTDISEMFYGSSSLVNLNVSNWNTSSVVDMSSTFVKTGSLTTVDVANWNTSNVENMSGMFSGSGLTTLDVSRWEVNNVKNMANMFNGIYATVLDLSNWDTSNVENMNSMFEYSALVTIYASNKFDTSAVTDSDYMFSGTSNLVGGNGTTWDYTHTNKEYARIDTATTPGYFTLKTN